MKSPKLRTARYAEPLCRFRTKRARLGVCSEVPILSKEAMEWAIEQQCGDPNSKFVLVCLGKWASQIGIGAYPSIQTLIRATHLSERTIRRSLRKLEELQLIIRGDQSLSRRISRSDRRPIVYDLLMPARGAIQPPRHATGGQMEPNGGPNATVTGGQCGPRDTLKKDTKKDTQDVLQTIQAELQARFGIPKGGKQ